MYGWIVDGISSLFEPVSDQNHTEWPGNSAQVPGRSAVTPGTRPESHARPAKRNYQSVHVSNGASQGEQREAKRRKLDVVLSFVKKAVAGVAGLLRRNPQNKNCERYRRYEESKIQPVTLMGIDELQTSWLTGTKWRMGNNGFGSRSADNSAGGINDGDGAGRNSFPRPSPLSVRKYSGAVLSGGILDGGKDRGPSLPSRSALGVGLGAASGNAELSHLCFGHGRCYTPGVTVQEAMKQNDKEHYRRLLEMLGTEKCSKSQPLTYSRTTPQAVSSPQGVCRQSRFARAFDSMPRTTGSVPATPSAYSWRDSSATNDVKERRTDILFTKTLTGTFQEKQGSWAKSNQKHPSDTDLSTEVATRLHLVDPVLTQQSDKPPTRTNLTRHADEDLPRLTRDMAEEVSAALNQADPSLVLSAAFKLRITQRDLATLREGNWLNDEVINFYLSLVMERSSSQAAPGPRVYCFSTFFLPKLRGGEGGQAGGHWAVRRWTKAVDLFLHDLILVPLHLDVHWAMAVIDLRSQSVKSYDSMGQRHDDICSLLLIFLREEHKVKKGKDLDTSRWTVSSIRACEIPQQKNGSDCGIFACKYADYISKGRPLDFKQCHMPLFRKVMVWEILNKKLL
ncbi:sentrin-specific protease 2 isoform X1 [Gadus macrocephalus]|uniref:sentrin-specific protease 2 isoform X1 n=1 Tax=Gadus macrocephalus TaxID=80720 RepID=UPI0028CB862A|nr:sentrin-specific protease 2 isoform X1 [Gadus macrocephalus]